MWTHPSYLIEITLGTNRWNGLDIELFAIEKKIYHNNFIFELFFFLSSERPVNNISKKEEVLRERRESKKKKKEKLLKILKHKLAIIHKSIQ